MGCLWGIEGAAMDSWAVWALSVLGAGCRGGGWGGLGVLGGGRGVVG